jgi:hypothetical protein
VADAFDSILFDNDALSLLAASGLLSRTLAVLSMSRAEAYRLESLTHMVRRKRIGRLWTDDVRDAALHELQTIQVWRHQPGADLLQRLVDVYDVDQGEAVIFGSGAELSSLLMVSGDKRSMRALCEAPELRDIRDSIAGRVVCLESLLHALIDSHGAATIGQAFQPVSSHHVTLRVVFTKTNMADEVQCHLAIDSYLRELKGWVGADFLREPAHRGRTSPE